MNPSGKLHQVLRYLLLGIVIFILLTFIFRTPLAAWYLHQRIDRFNKANQATLKISGVKIQGMASILVTGICLKPDHGDTLLKIDSAYASIGILKLLAGRIALHNVKIVNTGILLVNNGGKSNYSFLLRPEQSSGDSASGPLNYAAAVDRLMRFVFDKIPLSLNVLNFSLAGITNGHRLGFHIGTLNLADHFFRSAMDVTEDSTTACWMMAGKIDNHNRMAEFRLYPADSAKVSIPYISFRWNARVDFDTLAFSIAEQKGGDDLAQINGFASVTGLRVDHRRIAAGPVEFARTEIRYLLNIGADYAELDSSTRVTFNKIDFRPYIRYRPKPSKQLTLQVHKPQFPAQDLFSSFPQGLFTNLDGIRVKGNLSWNLDFFVDLSNPDSLRFETALDRHQFSVLSYGNADLAKINGPFSYTAYDRDVPVRTFIVGPENPEFRTLDRISHYLQVAVLTSEDGSFYQHRGFLPDAFRESIITNIKEHRFARGGSTISMQLVKNVFLSRNKTVARKLEEALIVWLIENQGLSTKEQMYEVYLNLIEWGPMVYGASEAAHYYFNKDVSRLTLAEAIFMASIIPRPKWFKYSFDESGHLRESNAGFYRLVSEKMLNKGWITPQDAEKLVPDIELKGPAKLLLKQVDVTPADTLQEL
ncbi:MAG: transglycosylase domain-containing protein [Bacteroidetes bacterium]|nr:transglycosylase domain-containing protein [Bacteroidota bacterium]